MDFLCLYLKTVPKTLYPKTYQREFIKYAMPLPPLNRESKIATKRFWLKREPGVRLFQVVWLWDSIYENLASSAADASWSMGCFSETPKLIWEAKLWETIESTWKSALHVHHVQFCRNDANGRRLQEVIGVFSLPRETSEVRVSHAFS